MDSQDWASYIETTDGITKPWLLIQWRLQLLKDQQASLDPADYAARLAALHKDLMALGEWWRGQEADVFNPREPHDRD